MDEMTDNQLVAHYLAEADESYLAELFSRYLKPIYNFILRYSGRPLEVEDIAQEVFIKVWKNLASFNQDKNFKVWLFQIARNTCIDHLRKKKDLLFSEMDKTKEDDGVPFADTLADAGMTPDEVVDQELLAAQLETLLEKLTPESRLVLLLYYKEGLNFREISEVTGVSIDTVKSRQRRALLKLKSLLTEP